MDPPSSQASSRKHGSVVIHLQVEFFSRSAATAVQTGLSARSYGRLSYYVTRIAAGRVERGLPQALRRCGYKTVTLYPAYGAFLSARKFQETTGIDRFTTVELTDDLRTCAITSIRASAPPPQVDRKSIVTLD